MFFKKFYIIAAISILALFSFSNFAKANILIPNKDSKASELADRAIVAINGDQETLVLSPQISADAQDFGWLIPFPDKPEITYTDENIFKSLTDITKNSLSPQSNSDSNGTSIKTQSAETLDSIGTAEKIYTSQIIKPEKVEDVTSVIDSNGLFLPEEANYLIEEYIELGWQLAFIKINIKEANLTEGETTITGYLPPITFTFQNKNPYYPAKLLKVSEFYTQNTPAQQTNTDIKATEEQILQGEKNFSSNNQQTKDSSATFMVDLFVIANGQKTAEGFKTVFGDWVTKSQIQNLSMDSNNSPWFVTQENKLYLTQLSGTIDPSTQNSELHIKNDSGNSTSIEKTQSGFPNFLNGLILFLLAILLILISPIGVFFILGILIASLSKSKGARATGWIFELLSLFTLVLIGLWLSFAPKFLSLNIATDYVSTKNISLYYFYSALATALVLMIIVIILQIRKSTRNKEKLVKSEKSIAEKIFDDKKEPLSKDLPKAKADHEPPEVPSFAPENNNEKEIELEPEEKGSFDPFDKLRVAPRQSKGDKASFGSARDRQDKDEKNQDLFNKNTKEETKPTILKQKGRAHYTKKIKVDEQK